MGVAGKGRGGGNVRKPFVTYGTVPYGWIIKEIFNARTSITLIVCDATVMKSYISSSWKRGGGNTVKVEYYSGMGWKIYLHNLTKKSLAINDLPIKVLYKKNAHVARWKHDNEPKRRSILVSGKLPNYPSLKTTLTLTSHLGQNVGLGDRWEVFQKPQLIQTFPIPLPLFRSPFCVTLHPGSAWNG